MDRPASVLLLLLPLLVASQSPFCPSSYQTSSNFSKDFIEEMTQSSEGLILLLSTGSGERCQRISFSTEGAYNFSHVTADNETSSMSNSYTASAWTLGRPASLSLAMTSPLLGTPSLIRQVLHPVIATKELIVFVTANQGLLSRTEQASVFVPFPYEGKPSMTELKNLLNSTGVPLFNTLKEVSRDCSSLPSSSSSSSSSSSPPLTNILNVIADTLNIPNFFLNPTTSTSTTSAPPSESSTSPAPEESLRDEGEETEAEGGAGGEDSSQPQEEEVVEATTVSE